MQTVEIKIYKFDELSKEAQQKALQSYANFNVDYDWWQFVYEDANNIGLTITGFDTAQKSITGRLADVYEACVKILKEHGEESTTRKLATKYFKEQGELVTRFSDGINTEVVAEDKEDEYDERIEEIEKEFTRELLEEYLLILTHEYEYLTSEESIKESLIANEYDFTEDGKIWQHWPKHPGVEWFYPGSIPGNALT